MLTDDGSCVLLWSFGMRRYVLSDVLTRIGIFITMIIACQWPQLSVLDRMSMSAVCHLSRIAKRRAMVIYTSFRRSHGTPKHGEGKDRKDNHRKVGSKEGKWLLACLLGG